MNIFNDKGLDLTLVEVMGKGSNQNRWNGIDMVVEGFVISIRSFGTNTCGRMSSSGQVCDSQETVTGVIAFPLFGEGVSSDNMGNKEFSVGVFSIKEGSYLIRSPTIEEMREAFFLYHINIIPITIIHIPTNTNKANISFGDKESR